MAATLQVALDFVDLERALKVAAETVEGGADWLEAGTPLIKSEGLDAVRALRKRFPKHTIVADMKTMDAGRGEMEAAAKAGADVAIAMGVASDSTLVECVEAGRNYGLRIGVDLLNCPNAAQRARELEAIGVDYLIVHNPIDDQMLGLVNFELLQEVASAVSVPVAGCGGITSETAADALRAGASVLVVGGFITKSPDAKAATQHMRQAMATLESVPSELYHRATEGHVRGILATASTANISDGSHRLPSVEGIHAICLGAKVVGPAVTARAYPGDWAKPVEAIDVAPEGSVIVIDAAGRPPAVWGELATQSAVQKKLAGVVIDGAIRDVPAIRELRFPAFARLIASNAGEPKGLGEINVPVRIGGVQVMPGDWIVGDDDGVLVLPGRKVVEMANHGMDCFEKENRILEEIRGGKTTLAQVMQLLKWEKN